MNIFVERVETFDIYSDGVSYTLWDTDEFNNWGERNGIYSADTARQWATWAHLFKTGRTYQTFCEWRDTIESQNR